MEKQVLTEFIQCNIPNVTITQKGLEMITAQFEETEFARNELLLKQGRVSGYFFLAKGLVRAFTFDPSGNELTTAFYQESRVIFEAASFFLRIPSDENLQALTNCHVFATTFEKLNGLFHALPEFREFGRAILVKELVAAKQRTLAAVSKSAEERYAQLMADNSEIFQAAQLKHIASYLGITDTSLSRIRRQFMKK